MEPTGKAGIRRQCAEKRNALTDRYITEAGQRITEAVLASPDFTDARTVFCYVSTPREPDTRTLITEALSRGKTVCVPRCTGKGRMEAVRIRSLRDLEEGAYGIPEPKNGSEAVRKDIIDLCLIPCVSADPEGRRLGHGGGYYDRFLSGIHAKKICLCFDSMMSARLPEEPYDVRADRVVTECGMYRAADRASEQSGNT